MSYVTNHCTLSIDIGGSKLMVGIVSEDGTIIHKEKALLNPDITTGQIVDLILDKALQAVKQNGELQPDCIGIAIPGLADTDRGIWVYSCFSGIRDMPIVEILSEKLQLPVFIENDVNVCAYGEKVYGACKDNDNFFWITISNGVGGGLVLDGKLYTGAFKNAGEAGHINVVEDGAVCPCGNHGCLEAYASGPAIARRYYEKAAADSIPVMQGLNAKKIAELAKTGDLLAAGIYRETGHLLGKAISSVVNIINPEKVILGGGIALDMELFADEMRQTVDRMVFREANKNLKIERTALLYDAALIGASAIARERMKRI